MTDQQAVSQESQQPRREKVFRLMAVVAVGFALCAVMKTFVCGKFGNSYPCQSSSDQSDGECSSPEKE